MPIMSVRNVCIGDGDTGLLHLGNISQRNRGLHAVKAGEASLSIGVLDHIAVEVGHGTAGLDYRIDIRGAEQTTKAVIATRFVRQSVGPRMGRGGAES